MPILISCELSPAPKLEKCDHCGYLVDFEYCELCLSDENLPCPRCTADLGKAESGFIKTDTGWRMVCGSCGGAWTFDDLFNDFEARKIEAGEAS